MILQNQIPDVSHCLFVLLLVRLVLVLRIHFRIKIQSDCDSKTEIYAARVLSNGFLFNQLYKDTGQLHLNQKL